MKRSFLLGMLAFLVAFAGIVDTSGQQRTKEQLESIVLKVNKKNKIYDGYSDKIKSTELIDKAILTSGKEAFYVYRTVSDGQNSFAIVSGDERMPEILAYSTDSKFDVNNIPPAVRYWLECYAEEFNELEKADESEHTKHKIAFSGEGVMPLLNKTQWGQSDPYNSLCPSFRGERTVTGCVATAMSQVMRYYSFPEKGRGSVRYTSTTNRLNVTHDFSKDCFDWANMLDSYSLGYTNEAANAVAELMASCGASVKMDYCTSSQGGSGAYQSDLLNGYIENFGYDDDASFAVRNYCTTEDWHMLLINELNAGRPVNYGGVSMRDGGHSFIIDGYRKGEGDYPDYHVNWGWNGSCDGYYQIANLHPKADEIYATDNPFSESQQMTLGIMPEDGVSADSSLLMSSAVKCSLVKVKRGGNLMCNVASLYNCSYKGFTGTVSVALKSESGNLVILGKGIDRTLKYLEGTGNISIPCTVPDGIDAGKYIVCIVYKSSLSDNWKRVLSPSYPTLEVTDKDTEDTDPQEKWSEIGCSEFELLKGDDQGAVAANVYELVNLDVTSFIGTLSFTIADATGSPIFSFGASGNLPELGYREFMSEPVYVSGVIDKTLPDGHYRLYISAKNAGQTDESFVVLNDLTMMGVLTKELYYPVEVRNSVAYINGNEYVICPTAVSEVKEADAGKEEWYSVDGTEVRRQNARHGVYIRRYNGKTKKVLLP